MANWIEIIIPVRNPGAKLLESGASLRLQLERGFGVVLSDNHSTSGADGIERFAAELESAGIPVRRVRPPRELGRVQHWNWAHAQGEADWLKPLFVGDLLQPGYMARVRERVAARPGARFVRCDFDLRVGDEQTPATRAPFREQSLTPREFLRYFPSEGNWLGGPINAAYERTAWQAVGGFRVHLPACADLNLAAMLSVRHGIEVIHESLAIFQLHEQRFSHGISGRRVNGCFELWLILRQLRNYCRSVNLPWPENGVARGVARQARLDYWCAFKERIKQRLDRR